MILCYCLNDLFLLWLRINGNPLQYSCLENPMDRGAWWAAVHWVAQSQTRLNRLSIHACIGEGNGNPLHYSCLENPRDRGAWWAAVYGVTQSQTRLKWFSSSSSRKITEVFLAVEFLSLFFIVGVYFLDYNQEVRPRKNFFSDVFR